MEIDINSIILLTSIFFVTFLSLRDNSSLDVHILLLTQQADITKFRQVEESAIYRSKLSPHGIGIIGFSSVKLVYYGVFIFEMC